MPRKQILTVLGVGLLLRLGWALWVFARNPLGYAAADSLGYLNLAENLLRHHVFSQHAGPPLIPDDYRTPIYPFFLLLFKAAGFSPWGVVGFQILLSGATALLIFKCIDELWGLTPAALCGVAFYALDIPSLIFCTFILSETLAAFFLVAGLFFLIIGFKGVKRQEFRRTLVFVAVSACCFGLAILTHPIFLFLPIAITPSFFPWFKRYRLQGLSLAAVLVVVSGLTLTPWIGRNIHTFGRPFLASAIEKNFLYQHSLAVYAKVHNVSRDEAGGALDRAVNEAVPLTTPNAENLRREYLLHLGIELFLTHPLVAVSNGVTFATRLLFHPMRSYIDQQMGNLTGENTITVWQTDGSVSLWQKLRANTSRLAIILVFVQVALLAVFWASFGAGLIEAWRTKRWLAGVLPLSVLIYFTAILAGPVAHARWRVFFFPAFCLVAGPGLARLLGGRR